MFEMDAQLVPLEKAPTYLCLSLPRAIYYWLIDWLIDCKWKQHLLRDRWTSCSRQGGGQSGVPSTGAPFILHENTAGTPSLKLSPSLRCLIGIHTEEDINLVDFPREAYNFLPALGNKG